MLTQRNKLLKLLGRRIVSVFVASGNPLSELTPWLKEYTRVGMLTQGIKSLKLLDRQLV
jgi:hypothetical protein